MEIHQLEYSVTVAETGGFSRTAERCNVTQSSLSQQIKKLEQEIGHQLFDDKVQSYYQTETYQKAARKRGVQVKPLFGEALKLHRLRRFRLGGLNTIYIEGMMIAAWQNLERLIKYPLIRRCSFIQGLRFQQIPTRVITFSTG